MKLLSLLISILAVVAASAQSIETATVVSQATGRISRLPAEIYPFQRTEVRARLTAFVEEVLVDRGSYVKSGDVLVKLSAPEIAAQIAEARSKVSAVEARRAEAEAKLAAAEVSRNHLEAAAATPGVVTGQEVELSRKSVDSARGVLEALDAQAAAARAAIAPLEQMQEYLEIKAPYDAIVTERIVHPGALAAPDRNSPPLLVIEQQSRLRVVVAVPEADVASMARGARVNFRVPAYPGANFSGAIARIPNTIDPKTRTMPVELDAVNAGGRLAPGMYAEADWPIRRRGASLLVPSTAVTTTTDRSFVIRVTGGRAEWVDVAKGQATGDLVEVFGNLRAGDVVVKRASDEIRDGGVLGR
ncbi:MAG: efflux RND transporter periplasmic adaptor subunit [Bryobacteraceae bacterium]